VRYVELVKATLVAPIYVSVAWSLIISYQLFTETAVHSVAVFLDGFWVGVGEFLLPNIGVFAFIHAFAWIFVLSSVIPAIILGKGRSILLQFLLCLTLTLVATSIGGILELLIGVGLTTQLQASSIWLMNPIVGSLYLSAPYVFMLYIDLRSKKRQRKTEEPEQADAVCAADQPLAEQRLEECRSRTSSYKNRQAPVPEVRRRINYLQGASLGCLLLAALTIWIGNFILTMPQVVFNAIAQIAFGASLLWLGYSKDVSVTGFPHQQKEVSCAETNVEGGEKTLQEFSRQPGNATSRDLAGKTAGSAEILAKPPWGVTPPTNRFCVRRPKYIVDSQC
jgi:hypothetical protein